MKLKKLISDIEPLEIKGTVNRDIKGIVHDSREAGENDLFICIEGFQNDGHQYIEEAARKGCQVVVIEKKLVSYRQDLTYLRVKDSREAMSYLAARFYNYPLQDLKLVGVTGTNGKTTTTYLIKSILEQAGHNCGLIGTINVLIGNREFTANRTTPESLDIYRYFDYMRSNGMDYVVMEVSSHALELQRVVGMKFDMAIFTNISQDHLDFHHSLADYAQTKAQLFSQLKKKGWGIINQDDAHSGLMKDKTGDSYFTYGLKEQADYRAEEITLKPDGSEFVIKGEKEIKVELNISGMFNVYNALAAAACTRRLGISYQDIAGGLKQVTGIPGRFELINEGQEFSVVVDYAHTPDGMENVLSTARELIEGRLLVVFGCGGDRDQDKRPQMGRIGVNLGDYCFVTSDNPRSEDPGKIIDHIVEGIKEQEIEAKDIADYEIIPQRREAIFRAVGEAREGDMVMIIGKGHETYQIFKDKKIHFDDREVAREAINELVDGDQGEGTSSS